MDDGEMARVLARRLDGAEAGWSAEYAGLDEVNFTAANGDRFIIHVEKVEAFETVWAPCAYRGLANLKLVRS